MLRLKQLIVFLCLLNASVVFALPKSVQLEYDVARDGKLFARVKESFTQNGKQYRIQSITKGVGIYALLGMFPSAILIYRHLPLIGRSIDHSCRRCA